MKLGAIVRPFAYSPFRIGLAIHTPIWYSITERYTANLTSNLPGFGEMTENLADYLHPQYVRDFRLTTPWRFNVSMGTVVGGIMRWMQNTNMPNILLPSCLKRTRSEYINGTAAVNESLKGVHTFRVGMETKVSSTFSVRAGYNFRSALIYDDFV